MTLHHKPLSSLGYRMPAEWEPHAATLLSWPHSDDTWPDGRLELVCGIFAKMVRNLIEGEKVHINVADHEMESWARSFLRAEGAESSDQVIFHHIPTNDAWIRDHGPIFVKSKTQDPQVLALNWEFNSWGGKYPYELDNQVPQRLTEAMGHLCVDTKIVLEGGSIEPNGAGALLTTRACLLNPNRNPSMDQKGIEAKLAEFLATDHVLWLGEGIEGDDTDGHIDDITRFVSEDTILTTVESNKEDNNYAPLLANREQLKKLRTKTGSPYTIIDMPMPDPVIDDGSRLPASYANFYIANGRVLVPIFGTKQDDQALGILKDLFPDRQIIGINCRALVWGLGGIHCVTQQVPAAGR